MDILFFLKERTKFVRQFYVTAAAPFTERKRKIEAGDEPFEQPDYGEYSSGEPAYLDEWVEAEESLHILAYACVSMLAAALKLYFTTWESQFRKPARELRKDNEPLKAAFKGGWLAGYNLYFAQYVGINFKDCPADLKLLEEVVIARNSVQHPQSITVNQTRYSASDLKKLSHPFFLDENDERLLVEVEEAEKSWFLLPTLHVTGDKLIAAIEEVEKFCEWLEEQIKIVVYRR